MASFYVDTAADPGGDGTTSALTGEHCAWDTIADVNGASRSPGDYIYFKKGCTWSEILCPLGSGSAGSPVTYTSYGSGAKPKIDGGSTRQYCVVDTWQTGYVTLDGLEFADPTVMGVQHTVFVALVEQDTPNWTIQNCTFTNCGCELFGASTVVQDNTFNGPQPTGSSQGGLFIRGACSTSPIVRRNTVQGYYGRGIWFMNAVSNPTANDNIIYDIDHSYGTSNEGYGINFDGYGQIITGTVTATGNTVYNCAMVGIELENCSDGSLVAGNLIHDCDEYGIVLMNYEARGGYYGEQRGNDTGARVCYNVIYHCDLYGMKIYHLSGTEIWNNVFYDSEGATPGSISIADLGTPPAYFSINIDIRNNIMGVGAKSVTTKYAWENHLSAFDYNAVVNQVVEELSPVDNLTLAELQAGDDCMNSFLTSPGFVDADNNDYHLAVGSPCINTGASLGLTSDFEGASVPYGGTPDIGAYEYTETGYECVKRWNGTAWVRAKVNNRTGGAAWENRPVKRWTGAAWSEVDGLGG